MPVMIRTVMPSDTPLVFEEAYGFFTSAVKFWANQLGMTEYSIVVDYKDDPDSLATFHVHTVGRTIDIYLSCNSRVVREAVNFNRAALFQTALHELLEAMLIEHDSIMQNDGMTDNAKLDATEALRHKIIHAVTPVMVASHDAHQFLQNAIDEAEKVKGS